MKRVLLTSVIVLSGLMFLTGVYMKSAETKVGVINLADCWNKYDKVKVLKEELEGKKKLYESELEQMIKQIKEVEEKLQAAPAGTSIRMDKLEEYELLKQKAKLKKDRYDAEIARFIQQHQEDIYSDIASATESVAKELSYNIVFKGELTWDEEGDDTSASIFQLKVRTRVVMYYDTTMDITPHVLEKLNAEYEKNKAGGDGTPGD